MTFKIESAIFWGFGYKEIIKQYGNVFDEFGIVENECSGDVEIQIETLEDLLNLARKVDNRLIIDPNCKPPKITIYDYWIE